MLDRIFWVFLGIVPPYLFQKVIKFVFFYLYLCDASSNACLSMGPGSISGLTLYLQGVEFVVGFLALFREAFLWACWVSPLLKN